MDQRYHLMRFYNVHKPKTILNDVKNEIKAEISLAIKSRQDSKKLIDQTCTTAEDFTKHYYENFDKRRHLVLRMYMDTSVVVWNGTGTTGKDQIWKFLLELPLTEHTLCSLDAQRVLDPVSHKFAFLVNTSGNMKLQDRISKPFNRTFMITIQDNRWKIATDCFRFLE